ncbi:hypothetical protein ACVB8X_00730 [Streptomyces sp. NRAIS4]
MSGREETAAGTGTEAEALRRLHGARAHSAYDRAVAACRYAGVGRDAAKIVPRDPVGRAANALRLSAESLAALTTSAPDPAADARCARNAAATAALAAQVAAARDSDATAAGRGSGMTAAARDGGTTAPATESAGISTTESAGPSATASAATPATASASASTVALRAALAASQAAAAAAGGSARGRDAALNASAEEAERLAVATARAAGWFEAHRAAD